MRLSLDILDESAPPTPSRTKYGYEYDSLDQLASVKLNGSPLETFHFDATGNRTSADGFTANVLNQYTQIPGVSSPLGYDDRGNLTFDGRFNYEYDAQDRLIFAEAEDLSVALKFAYDSDGRRVSKTVLTYTAGEWEPRQIIKYAYAGTNLIAEFDGNSGQMLRRYLWGPGLGGGIGGLLAEFTYKSDGSLDKGYQPIYDGSGNVVGLIDLSDGSLAASFAYSAFGQRIAAAGAATDACPFGWQTRYTDTETGLLLWPMRYYSPVLGRWITRDPSGESGGVNLYTYASNAPLNKVDPTGQEPADSDESRQITGLNLWFDAMFGRRAQEYRQTRAAARSSDVTSSSTPASAVVPPAQALADVAAMARDQAKQDFAAGLRARSTKISGGGVVIAYPSRAPEHLDSNGTAQWLSAYHLAFNGLAMAQRDADAALASQYPSVAWQQYIDKLHEQQSHSLCILQQNSAVAHQVEATRIDLPTFREEMNLADLDAKTGKPGEALYHTISAVGVSIYRVHGYGAVATPNGVSSANRITSGVVTNPLPANGVFSRVMPAKYAQAFARGEGTLGAGEQIFIGAADDLAGIGTKAGAQARLALFEDVAGTVPKVSGDTLVTFRLRTTSGVGLSSPIQTVPPRGYGFTPGGLTGGGAREWLIGNGTAGELGAYDIILTPLR